MRLVGSIMTDKLNARRQLQHGSLTELHVVGIAPWGPVKNQDSLKGE